MGKVKDLECTIIHYGEETLGYCRDSVENQTYGAAKVITVSGISPLSASLNQRHKLMELPYSVKVDADMVLYPDCFETLYKVLSRAEPHVYAVTGMLFDPLIGRMGAVHMERTAYVRDVTFPDVIGCDRHLRKVMAEQNYHIYELEDIVGEHWSDWSAEAVFKRHMRVGQKHLHYRNNHHKDWIRSIGEKWIGENSGTAFLALLGYCHGLLTRDEHEKGEGYGDEAWAEVKMLIKDSVVPKPTELLTLLKSREGKKT